MTRCVRKYLFLGCAMLAYVAVFASDKEDLIKILQGFLYQNSYAVKYKSYLYKIDGSEMEVSTGDPVVVKDNLSIYTNTGQYIFIANENGSLLINNEIKKMTFYPRKLSKKEKEKLIDKVSSESYKTISSMLDKADSVKISYINGLTVYTSYLSDDNYTRSECWVDKVGQIKELRYFFKEGDYVYQRIVYNNTKIDFYKPLMDFSNYLIVSKNNTTPTEKYKDYALVMGE